MKLGFLLYLEIIWNTGHIISFKLVTLFFFWSSLQLYCYKFKLSGLLIIMCHNTSYNMRFLPSTGICLGRWWYSHKSLHYQHHDLPGATWTFLPSKDGKSVVPCVCLQKQKCKLQCLKSHSQAGQRNDEGRDTFLGILF
jgi:hypothetical protein